MEHGITSDDIFSLKDSPGRWWDACICSYFHVYQQLLCISQSLDFLLY